MIRVTRIDGTPIVINAEFIQSVENTPDTLITLTNGYKFMVKDSVDEVVLAFRKYKFESIFTDKPARESEKGKV